MEVLERIWEYLSRNLKIAWKSVRFNFKQYICFFLAIFIVQMFYGIMAISTSNNKEVERDHVGDEFSIVSINEDGEEEVSSYDMVLYDLNNVQYNIVANYNNNKIYQAAKESFYLIVKDVGHENDIDGKEYHDLYISFSEYEKTEAHDTFVSEFIEKYLEPNGTVNYVETDVLNFDSNIAAINSTFVIITIALLGVGILLLIVLYNIRMNQYKFTYGIYMTCGADFKRLFGTAFWELFLISLVTFIPAIICSTVTVWLIYSSSGFSFVFFLPGMWLLVALFSLVVVTVSVISPMWVMSKRWPMALLRTEDNSNYVSSPRRSFNIVGKKFPFSYEIYSIWRFRKYNIQLLVSAIAFCAIFIMGLYLGNVYDTNIEYRKPQYVLDLSDTKFHVNAGDVAANADDNSITISDMLNIEGVKAIEQTGDAKANYTKEQTNFSSPQTEAVYIDNGSHAMFPSNRAAFLTNFLSHPTEKGWKVTNEVVYKAIDAEQIKYLEAFEFDHDGEYNDILKTDKRYCIVGDSISNMKKFNVKVGDTVKIGIFKNAAKKIDTNASGRSLLNQQLKFNTYEYIEFEVVAVIHDIPCASLPIYLLGDDYEAVTGVNPDATLLNVYTDPAIVTDNDKVNSVLEEIKDYCFNEIGTVHVENTRRLALQAIATDKHNSDLYVVISVLLLVISPLIWFFNQILYYRKREKEFNIIQSMGAKASDIRIIYLLGGLSMAVLSFAVSILLSYIASYAVYYFVNAILPSLTNETVRYQFYLPWYALVISAVMSVSCGFFSAYLPYRSYFKERFSLENGGSGMKDDE